MTDLALHRVVCHTASEIGARDILVRWAQGIDPEDAIDIVLRDLRLLPDWRIDSVWAVPDDGIVTYSCKSLGDFRRGAPIPRQRDRAL
jgi:hypothetical protein